MRRGLRVPARLRVLAGSLPPAFWVLWWGVLLNRAASFVVAFLGLFLVQERGLDLERAGAVVGLYGLGGILGALVGGAIADRVGRRFTMLVSLAVNAAAVGSLAVARGTALIAALTLVAGLAGQTYTPALNAAVADVVPLADRHRAFGLVYWAANVGYGVGFAVAGAVGPHSLPALFVLDAATTAGFLLLVARRMPETRPSGAERDPVLAGLGRVLTDCTFMAFLGIHLLALLVFTQWELMLPTDAAAHGVGRAGYALLMWLNCAGAIVLQPLLGGWIGRRDPTRSLVASALLFGAGYGLNAFASGLPTYVVGAVLWTTGEVLCLPVASALPAALAPPELRGRYQGVFATVFAGAFALSPWLSGKLAARAGARALWLACLAAGVLAAIGHLATGGARRRRLAERARQADAGAAWSGGGKTS
jgi:MFS family permease